MADCVIATVRPGRGDSSTSVKGLRLVPLLLWLKQTGEKTSDAIHEIRFDLRSDRLNDHRDRLCFFFGRSSWLASAAHDATPVMKASRSEPST